MTDQLSRPSSRLTVRARVLDWLHDHADVPVRLVVAPPGFGKSAALAAYRGRRRRVALALDGRLRAAEFAASLRRAVRLSAAAESGPSAFLGAAAPLDIVLDDAHLASGDLPDALGDLVADLPPDVHLIVASRRRDILDVGTLFARGHIAVCDQTELALDADAARALFFANGLDAGASELDALVSRSDGWPLAIAGTLRERLREPQSLESAYDRWRRGWNLPAIDLVSALLESVPPVERAAVQRHFSDGGSLDQSTLAVLHRCGFFVRFDGGTFRLMRWVDELFPQSQARPERPLLEVELFGRFSAGVGGVPIVWARRRDQQIVKYLLLRPDASATRAELAEVFWPNTARPLAMQNLRTACSTIRRAIGNVVGMQNVDTYLLAGERLVLNRGAIASDVDRFHRHVALAEAGDSAGTLNEAIANLRAAERIYRSGLFAGDVGEPVFVADAQRIAAIYARVLTRLSAALIERGSPDVAREYAAKALKLGLFPGGSRGAHVDLRLAAP